MIIKKLINRIRKKKNYNLVFTTSTLDAVFGNVFILFYFTYINLFLFSSIKNWVVFLWILPFPYRLQPRAWQLWRLLSFLVPFEEIFLNSIFQNFPFFQIPGKAGSFFSSFFAIFASNLGLGFGESESFTEAKPLVFFGGTLWGEEVMKRGKFDSLMSPSRLKLLQILMAVVFFYMLFMSFEIPLVLRTGLGSASGDEMNSFISDALPRPLALESEGDFAAKDTPVRPSDDTLRSFGGAPRRTPTREFKKVSGLVFNDTVFDANVGGGKSSELHRAAKHAWAVGRKLWDELESGRIQKYTIGKQEKMSEQCPHSITLSGSDFKARNQVLVLPCGLTLWSHITVVGTPRWAHQEYDPKIAVLKEGDESVMVSQFMMELQGLKTVDGEDPPRILHFNPRLKGDWSGKPVIEQNTCYRMQWGSALRCEGWKSRADEETSR